LPLAFQERYCLTERHPRCEMYKYAQEVAGAGPVPAAKLTGATSGSRRAAVSLALGAAGGDTTRRPALAIAGGIGGVILIVLIVLLLGSCFGGPAGPGSTDDASVAPQASGEATPAPQATPLPQATPAPEATDGAPTDATEPPQTSQFLILYQVQEGEALLKIAETFGVTRRSILMANEGMEDTLPYVEAGKIIVVPVSSELSIEQVEAIPGYQGPAP
jgi:LysM repeat protein